MLRQTILALTIGLWLVAPSSGAASHNDPETANDLMAVLRAGRAIVAANQDRINDPAKGQKDLDSTGFVAQVRAQFEHTTGKPATFDPESSEGRLVQVEMDAIAEVIDASQTTFKAPGPTFKGFIPPVFSRMVSEVFNRRAGGEAEMKVTAPADLVRNRKSAPDAWELDAITKHFESPDWPKGQPFTAVTVQTADHSVFRIAVPEYYRASCLSCHGSPKGAIDITGYPKEGAAEGDLGGVISIKLVH
jgi:hypothetical protein